jgi:hypothetical protein
MNSDSQTVAQARAVLHASWEGGTTCPVCYTYFLVKKRSLTVAMAFGLIKLYQEHQIHGMQPMWVKVPDLFERVVPAAMKSIRGGGDFAKLRHWGLVQQMPNQQRKDGSKRAGMYSITPAGTSFVLRQSVVPAAYYECKGQGVVGWDSDNITIADALKKEFDYQELMMGK